MPHGYHHLTYEQRCQIYALKKSLHPQKEIAAIVKTSQSTVSRELARNHGRRGYRYKQAHGKATARRKNASSQPKKLHLALVTLMERMMREDQLSPEQISGRLKLTNNIEISHERIYLHVWDDKRKGGDIYKFLRRNGKKYNKRGAKLAGRGLIPNRVGIEERPTIVDKKERVGDFEGDTIVGAKHRGAILSLVDRKTKLTRLRLLVSGAKATPTTAAIVEALMPLVEHVQTITTDNGKEFAQHEIVSQALNTKVFFAHPYHSWERGLNENTNGLVRQYFPKGADFTKITADEVAAIEEKLNNRPRKTLGYRTPNEEFLRLTGLNLNYALHG